MIRASMGPMGDELIVEGQRVYPRELIEAGFHFSPPWLILSMDMTPAVWIEWVGVE